MDRASRSIPFLARFHPLAVLVVVFADVAEVSGERLHRQRTRDLPALPLDDHACHTQTHGEQHAYPSLRAAVGAAPTLLGWGVAVGEEPEVSLVVPADQRQAARHHDSRLSALRRRGTADQHALGQTCAVALPGAQQTAAEDIWKT